MTRSILAIALLLAASATALAAPVAEHTASIDLFEADTNPDKPDWEAARSGAWTKPYMPWVIDAGQGDGVIDFGDIRFRDEVVTGRDDVDVVMVVRINGIDDYDWRGSGLRLASRPKDPSDISSDPSTWVWEDQPGFYLFDHEITDLTVVGLPYSSKTTIEVVWLAVTGSHDSMASHGLTHCVGTDLVIDKSGAITPFTCGGTDLKLAAIGSQLIQAFPTAPESVPTPAKSEGEDINPEEIFKNLTHPCMDPIGPVREKCPDVPKVVDPPGMGLK